MPDRYIFFYSVNYKSLSNVPYSTTAMAIAIVKTICVHTVYIFGALLVPYSAQEFVIRVYGRLAIE